MVIVVYFGMMCIMTVGLYTAMLNVHHRGRILDNFRRLTAREEALMCPLDSEVSLRALKEILNISRRAQRQIIVTDLLVTYYALDDEQNASGSGASTFDDKFTHIAVYNCPVPDAQVKELPKRTLYRHFVVLPDGEHRSHPDGCQTDGMLCIISLHYLS